MTNLKMSKCLQKDDINFNPFPTSYVVCSYSLVAYIANTMDPDQTAPKGAVWSGSIVFASMIKSSLKSNWIYTADVKKDIFWTEKISAG